MSFIGSIIALQWHGSMENKSMKKEKRQWQGTSLGEN